MVSFFACKRACWASSFPASERWPLGEFVPGKFVASMGIFFVVDRGGSSDLALVATPPAVPSGVHLSTAGEDLCFLDVGLDPFLGWFGGSFGSHLKKKNKV